MKLTAGSRHIDLPLSEEAEERLFLELSGLIYREFNLESNKEAVERFADELLKVDVLTPIIGRNAEVKDMLSTYKPPQVYTDRKLVLGRCKCGKHYSVWIYNDKSVYNFVCSGCEENIYIKKENLIESSYRCPECNKKYSFWSNGKESFELNCKNCRTKVRMSYDKENNIMINTLLH